ncbi:MAG: HAD hydrolase-like protein [Patescibacteria group bacterium]
MKSIIFDFDGVFGDTLEPVTEFLTKFSWKSKSKVRSDILKLLMSNRQETRLQRYFKDRLALKLETYLVGYGNCLFEDRLKEVSQLQAPKAILSNNYSFICKRLLGSYTSLFDLIIGDGEADTKVKGFELIFQNPKFAKSSTIFITDTVGDILEARKVLRKNQIYGVSWGFHDSELLKSYLTPGHILTDFKKLTLIDSHKAVSSLSYA